MAQTEPETVNEEETTCKDSKRKAFIEGKKQRFCKWVSKDKETRCKNVLKVVKTKISKKTGLEVEKVVKLRPKKLCTCTCPKTTQDTDPEEKLCPAHMEEASAFVSPFGGEFTYDDKKPLFGGTATHVVTYQLTDRGSCLEEGYKKNQICSYEYKWRGCTYDELTCEPKIKCECANEFLSQDDSWSCQIISYVTCDPPPRPPPVGTPPPYLVPAENGDVCFPGDPKPKDPDTVDEEEEVVEEDEEVVEEEEEVVEEEDEVGQEEDEEEVQEEEEEEELEVRRRLRH